MVDPSTHAETPDSGSLLMRLFDVASEEQAHVAMAAELQESRLNRAWADGICLIAADLSWFDSLSQEHQRKMILEAYLLVSLSPGLAGYHRFIDRWAGVAHLDSKHDRLALWRRNKAS
ncbi:MAG: hypothetical protein QF664_07970 [Dehalococcoidia bacterium]|nr:hypothetical protein [Dehalococcoidia bacterium]